jgi:predicted ester cyclase
VIVRAYYKATDAQEWAATGDCVGQGYVWIDHGTGVVARTPDELQAALTDEGPWQGTSRFDIEYAFETGDGALIVQGVRSGTVTGSWRGMEVTGQKVTFPFCAVMRFDDDGRIVREEQYYDMLSVRRQLGYS